MSLLHGKLLWEWLYFDKPQHAFENADRNDIHCSIMGKWWRIETFPVNKTILRISGMCLNMSFIVSLITSFIEVDLKKVDASKKNGNLEV
jgi:hypothetical protein